MKLARVAVFAAAAALLAGGYFASQFAAFNGTAAQYAQAIDTPVIKYFALLVLVACIVSVAMPQKEEPA